LKTLLYFLYRLGLPREKQKQKKTELYEDALQTGGICKRQLYVLAWTENTLKTELFENDDITMICDFPSQT